MTYRKPSHGRVIVEHDPLFAPAVPEDFPCEVEKEEGRKEINL